MSDGRFDLLETMSRLVGNTRTMAGLSGDPRMRDALRDGENARAIVEELIEAAGDYFTGWCQDEADSQNDGIGPVCGPEQHKAAVRLRDALARVRSS